MAALVIEVSSPSLYVSRVTKPFASLLVAGIGADFASTWAMNKLGIA